MSQDSDVLQPLSIFHYIVGGLAASLSVLALPCLILAYPVHLVAKQLDEGSKTPPLGALFLLIGSVILLIILTYAGLIIAAGRSLAQHRRYAFCVTVAVLEWFFFPFGTILGTVTFILLCRQRTQQLFASPSGAGLPPRI